MALEPFRRLQRQLMLVSLIGVVISIIASVGIARGIARPVRELAGAARRIAAGNYATIPSGFRKDEIGDLAAAFRTMQDGIVTRESRITDLAYRDALTGLPNRVRFVENLERALASAESTATPVSVLLMDLDHFKYVNDTLGHPIGDLLAAGGGRRGCRRASGARQPSSRAWAATSSRSCSRETASATRSARPT